MVVIQYDAGFYLDCCRLAVAQRDNFKRAVEIRIIATRSIHQCVSICILFSFIGNIGYFDGAARYGKALLAYCECYIGDGWLVVDGSHVNCSSVFNRRVVACAGTDNLVLESCVVVAEVIRLGLVSELAQICDINNLAFGNGRSIVCKRSDGREPRDDDRGECLGCMAEIEFGLRKRITSVFVDVDDKFFRDGGKFRV